MLAFGKMGLCYLHLIGLWNILPGQGIPHTIEIKED